MYKKNDWKCTKCEYLNFKKRSSCRKCKKPKYTDWFCISCCYVNYETRTECKKCGLTKGQKPGKRTDNNIIF